MQYHASLKLEVILNWGRPSLLVESGSESIIEAQQAEEAELITEIQIRR